jgi:hypothetical protein
MAVLPVSYCVTVLDLVFSKNVLFLCGRYVSWSWSKLPRGHGVGLREVARINMN